MLRLSRSFLAATVNAALVLAVLVPVATARQQYSPVTWAGNGTTWDGSVRTLNLTACDGSSTPYLLWVLSASKATSASISLPTGTVDMARGVMDEDVFARVLAEIDEVFNQHAKGRAPVTNVIAGNNGVAHEPIETSERVTNDGGAQVPDVHLLRHIWRRVVNDNGSGLVDHGNTRSLIIDHLEKLVRQEVGRESDVDKPGTGNLNVRDAIEIKVRDNLLRHIAGWATENFGHRHDPVHLIVHSLRRAENGIGTRCHGVKRRHETLLQGVVGGGHLPILPLLVNCYAHPTDTAEWRA